MKKHPPSLVILTPGFPEDESDSTCLPFLQSLIRTINKDFSWINIIVVSFQYPFTPHEYVWFDNHVFSFGGRNKGRLPRRMLWWAVWRKLKKIKDNHHVIGLFSLWLGECALVGHHFAKKYGIIHHCWIAGQDAKAHNKFVPKIKPAASELVAISDFVADEFFKNYLIRPLHIIPNGIEKELFEKNYFKRTIDVLGAGSLIPLKQYDVFIDCMIQIKKTIPEICSIIAGKGPEWYSLKIMTRQNGLEDHLFLNGEMDHRSLLLLMQQTKVFLHPSAYEGFSMVCLEALYAGCHVVSFCKPMNNNFPHWHIVHSKEEMIKKTQEILTLAHPDHTSVMPYSIHGTAQSVIRLFSVNLSQMPANPSAID